MATTLGGGWVNPDYGFDTHGAMEGLSGILGGMFGNSGAPYDKAMEQYQKYGEQAAAPQQTYLNAGNQATGQYQDWLHGQQDPSGFINNLMNQYQESPYAQYMQNQSLRAGRNMASANGLIGSTPLMQQMQQNAHNIGNQDVNQWLQHVLGINTQYGQGQHNLMQGGQSAANSLSNIYNNLGQEMGQAAYGKEAGHQQDFWNKLGGGLGILGAFL